MVDHQLTGSVLQRMLKEHGIDVNTPLAKNPPGTFWLTLRSGPFDLCHNLPVLERVVGALKGPIRPLRQSQPVSTTSSAFAPEAIRSTRRHPMGGQPRVEVPVLQKIDSSRDIGGTFYAPGDWRQKLRLLAAALEVEFGTTFRDNGNSFDSCFQLEGQHPDLDFELRVKAYWKTAQLLQSESVTKAVGMNTKGLFYPNMQMQRKLQESINVGLSRIELTYTAASAESEDDFFSGVFHDQAEVDLNRAELALRKVPGLVWHLPIRELFDHFTEQVRGHQLLIVQPTLVALIFNANSKPKCYTGFYQVKQY